MREIRGPVGGAAASLAIGPLRAALGFVSEIPPSTDLLDVDELNDVLTYTELECSDICIWATRAHPRADRRRSGSGGGSRGHPATRG